MHSKPVAHGLQEPPQSTSVSLPSLIPSLQVLGRAAQAPATQAPPAQSPFTRHALPAAQPMQTGPPQSTSVSLPSLIPSLQEVSQTLLTHSPLAQSVARRHIFPIAHF